MMTPPPPAISKAEFDRRVAAGARTMREIDPEFADWYESGRRWDTFRAIVLGVAVLVFTVGAFLMLVLGR